MTDYARTATHAPISKTGQWWHAHTGPCVRPPGVGWACPYPTREGAQQTANYWHYITFPVGAWIRNTTTQRLTNGIVNKRFAPYAGEIVSVGTIGGMLSYKVQFGDFTSVVAVVDSVCYHCAAPDDESHRPECPDKALRALPHTPGYCA